MADENNTQFSDVYNCFLSKITDDMYLELTPADTLRDLQRLLKTVIPGFEFPRVCLDDYTISTDTIDIADVTEDDFVIETFEEEKIGEDGSTETKTFAKIDKSSFAVKLSAEEINILALLMKEGWVQRQLTSIEVTRMKYSGADFKMTSQANHMAKLESLLTESRRDSFHMQRLYKRRKKDANGVYQSNWHILRNMYEPK